jgi:hypothetical protein
MATPESKVKTKVKQILKNHKVYFFMPATHGYGSSGVPDIVACMSGRFIGIECKANTGKVTQLQLKNLQDIVDNNGISVVVDEDSIGVFAMVLSDWADQGTPSGGCYLDLIGTKGV